MSVSMSEHLRVHVKVKCPSYVCVFIYVDGTEISSSTRPMACFCILPAGRQTND